MNWKVVLLVFFLLSAAAVVIGVTYLNLETLTTFHASFPKMYLDEPVPLQPIDDDGPGG